MTKNPHDHVPLRAPSPHQNSPNQANAGIIGTDEWQEGILARNQQKHPPNQNELDFQFVYDMYSQTESRQTNSVELTVRAEAPPLVVAEKMSTKDDDHQDWVIACGVEKEIGGWTHMKEWIRLGQMVKKPSSS